MKLKFKSPLSIVFCTALVAVLGIYLQGVFARDAISGHIAIGKNYLVRGSYDRAIREFSRALSINPDDARAYIERGTAYNQQEKYDLAIKDFEKAISITPRNHLAFNNRGVSYFRQGNLKNSLEDFTRAIELDPDDAYARLNYAGAALAAGRGEGAAEKLTAFIEKNNWKNKFSGHCAVLAILSYKQAKDKAGADKLLANSLKRVSRLDWPYAALQYIDGKISPEELLESVKNSDYDSTQAHCFIALDLLNKEKSKLARGHLNWVSKYGTRNSVEYWLAKNLIPSEASR